MWRSTIVVCECLDAWPPNSLDFIGVSFVPLMTRLMLHVEEEQIPPLLKKELPKNSWDDEDVDDNDVKESWEDEDETAPAPAPEPPAEKTPKKTSAKASEKKGKYVEVVEKEEPLDPVAEKLRQER
ncbi:hypothetical protein RHMOL_Rhmol10G0132700 [Rhododendron molle]|uniref:Uncharacterized protein n=1 Tax=Rhododendron molle TaxID=49168 RepID=A0ACC0M2S8_RHOML|nr:hypothetical protein RHMOL_Rhmol10G0132700 [Rhododendron molle]